MGYSIHIGEHDPGWREDEYDDSMWYDSHSVVSMDGLEVGAPLNSSHDHSNFILPSYSSWNGFMRVTGLADRLEEDGIEIIPTHPGVCYITPKLHAAIMEVGAVYLAKHPVVEERRPCKHGMGDELFRSYESARMRWLMFWVDWAFNNCKHPVIANG